MTNRIPQEQIEIDKRHAMGKPPYGMPSTKGLFRYILALEEAYKEIDRLLSDKWRLAEAINQPKPSVDLESL